MTFLHIKTDGLYDVLGSIIVQTDTPILDKEIPVLYTGGKDGQRLLFGRKPTEFFDAARFRPVGPIELIGDKVQKTQGYPFPGEVRSVFWTRSGQRRYVVEATGQDYAGMLHIFNREQLSFATDRVSL